MIATELTDMFSLKMCFFVKNRQSVTEAIIRDIRTCSSVEVVYVERLDVWVRHVRGIT